MRLIDADELVTAFPNGERVTTECVKATINHMPTIEPVKEKWVPVTLLLPENGREVIFCDRNVVYEGFYVADSKEWRPAYSGFSFPNDKVTAWMPLPEPFREESE